MAGRLAPSAETFSVLTNPETPRCTLWKPRSFGITLSCPVQPSGLSSQADLLFVSLMGLKAEQKGERSPKRSINV